MIAFEKYHGTGNDFIIINGFESSIQSRHELAKAICDRHFGIGADGLMIARPSRVADIKMEFYNADGSVATMCGNGLRCFTKYAYEQGLANKPAFMVETLAGVIPVTITKFQDHGQSQIRIRLAQPIFDLKQLPVDSDEEKIIDQPMMIDRRIMNLSIVSVGTLHCVIFVSSLKDFPVVKYGEMIEQLPLFPDRTNVNFVEIIDHNQIKVRTYERGVGPTLSCGTGAVASALLAHKLKEMDPQIHVETPGGGLLVEVSESGNYLTGPAVLIGKGYFNWIHETDKGD